MKSLPQPAPLVRNRSCSGAEPVRATRSPRGDTGVGTPHTAADLAGLWCQGAQSRGSASPRAETHCSVEMPLPLPRGPGRFPRAQLPLGFRCRYFSPLPNEGKRQRCLALLATPSSHSPRATKTLGSVHVSYGGVKNASIICTLTLDLQWF